MSARKRGQERAARLEQAGRAVPARKGPRCPICGKPAVEDHRPFCSRRCADIDLGRWLGGRYAVPGEPIGVESEPDEGEDHEGADR